MPGPVGSLAVDTVRAPSTVTRMKLAGIVTSPFLLLITCLNARLGFNKFNGLGSRQDVYDAIPRHSTIGYLSPVEFERKVGLA